MADKTEPVSDRARWEARYSECGAETRPPSDFLRTHIDRLRGRVLDLACGAGRNAVFLAREGAVVEAIDLSFTALQTARQTARASGFDLFPVQADLGAFPLPVARYDGVVNIRFLDRALFPAIRRAVKPGGVVLFETFLVDQAEVGHPRNPDFLLERGELRSHFVDFEILADREGPVLEGEQEVFLAQLLARRRV